MVVCLWGFCPLNSEYCTTITTWVFKLAVVIWWHNLLEFFSSGLSLFYSMYITAGNVDEIQMLCKTAANMYFYLSLQCFYLYTENAYTVNVCEISSLKKNCQLLCLINKSQKELLDKLSSWQIWIPVGYQVIHSMTKCTILSISFAAIFSYKVIIHCILLFHFDPHIHNSTI